jgi:tRNA pseudouridine55 synthase
MNGILVIDKPQKYTSHDVVARLRGLLKERRIGHGGTLDPMATGVLPILVGRATRASEYLLGDKEYVAEVLFGVVTDTQDIEGIVTETSPKRPTPAELEQALDHFRGDILQTPPMVSAVKVGGKKLYEWARSGVTVDRPARPVTVRDLEILEMTADTCTLCARVTKGAYIRTLAHDLGALLGCGAALSGLRRTEASPYTLFDAVTLETVIAACERGQAPSLLKPVDTLFSDYPSVTVDEREEARCRNGAPFPLSAEVPNESLCRVYDARGQFLLLGRVQPGRSGYVVHTVKNFFKL